MTQYLIIIKAYVDDEGNKYLVIHSGSRNLGSQVASVYMDKAINYCKIGNLTEEDRKSLIKKLKEEVELLIKHTK